MKFEGDDRKQESNLIKHGFDFADAFQVFDFPLLSKLGDRQDYGEDRYIGIGLLNNRIVVIVYTETDIETVRIISLRKALSHGRKIDERYIKNRLGEDWCYVRSRY